MFVYVYGWVSVVGEGVIKVIWQSNDFKNHPTLRKREAQGRKCNGSMQTTDDVIGGRGRL